MKHTCHWVGCSKVVPPAMWGCKEHWFKLPKFLRDAIWNAYVPGQEVTKNPSAQYLVTAQFVRTWIELFETGLVLNEHELLKYFGMEKKKVSISYEIKSV